MPLVLVISPDSAVRAVVRAQLTADDFEVAELLHASSTSAVLPQVPDLVLLDWVSRTQNLLEFCRRLRSNPVTGALPVLIMTALSGEEDRILALEAGIDDLLLKPFLPAELGIRVKNLLKHRDGIAGSRVLVFGEFVLDKLTRRLYREGQEFRLRETEFRLLELFISEKNKVHTRDQLRELIRATCGEATVERTIDASIMRLRKMLAITGRRDALRTIRGVGYIMDA